MLANANNYLVEVIKKSTNYLVFSILILLIYSNSVFGQKTIRTITTSSFPVFAFNTLYKLENGIIKISETILVINFDFDGPLIGDTWKLSMRSTDITGFNTTNIIPLDRVEFLVDDNPGVYTRTSTAWQPLTLGTQELVHAGINPTINGEVKISFQVGTTALKRILGEDPDFYTLYLEFILENE